MGETLRETLRETLIQFEKRKRREFHQRMRERRMNNDG